MNEYMLSATRTYRSFNQSTSENHSDGPSYSAQQSLSHFTRNTSRADALVSVDAGLAGSGVADKLVIICLPRITFSKGAANPFGFAHTAEAPHFHDRKSTCSPMWMMGRDDSAIHSIAEGGN